ncbi:hypothetical protein PFFVO_06096, partial [Plasmodium falciparum Vietnam Oak-Knoll (FVO)]
MVVSDNSGKEFNGLEACRGANIFKGIRNDEWICGEFCGVHVCALKKKDTKGQESGKKYIIMKELLQRWLENFFEDYNRINAKISGCTKNGEVSKCIKGCIEKWVQEKTTEWQKINDTYIQEYTKNNAGGNTLTNFLEILIPKIDLTNDKKKIKDLPAFLKLYGCNCAGRAENSKEDDVVLCLLENLKKEIEQCNSVENSVEISGDQTKTACEKSPAPVEDDDEEPYEDLLLQETEENQVKPPEICPAQPPQPEIEGSCDPAPTTEPEETVPSSEETNNEQVPDTESETKPLAPTPPATPRPLPKPKPPKPDLPPALKNAMLSSTIMWSIGIGFAAFTYFFLK